MNLTQKPARSAKISPVGWRGSMSECGDRRRPGVGKQSADRRRMVTQTRRDQQPNSTARKNVVMKSERSSGLMKLSALKSAAGQEPGNWICRKKQVMKSERSSG